MDEKQLAKLVKKNMENASKPKNPTRKTYDATLDIDGTVRPVAGRTGAVDAVVISANGVGAIVDVQMEPELKSAAVAALPIRH